MIDEILFDEASHRYYDENGNNYISVTTIIGKYCPDFDTELWAMFTALKDHNYKVRVDLTCRSISVSNRTYKLSELMKDNLFLAWYKETKAMWNTKTAEACHRGNVLHNHMEDSINLSKGDLKGVTNNMIINKAVSTIQLPKIKTLHDLSQTKLRETHPTVYERLAGYIGLGFSIFAEKRVFLREFFIAGMIDVPLIIGKHFAILDWKTNKDELHKTAGYYKKIKVGNTWIKSDIWVETGEKFLYPLDTLEASKFNKYAMQLSLYAYILETWGYILLPNGLEIIHFPLVGEPKLIKVPYYRDEVITMLNHYKQSLVA